MSFNCWSQARLASIISTSALVGLTLEPSRLPELTRASGSDGNAPPPTTRNRPSRPLATLEPTGEESFSRPTCCGRLGWPPVGTIQIRSEERDVGKEGVRTCRSGGGGYLTKKQSTKRQKLR